MHRVPFSCISKTPLQPPHFSLFHEQNLTMSSPVGNAKHAIIHAITEKRMSPRAEQTSFPSQLHCVGAWRSPLLLAENTDVTKSGICHGAWRFPLKWHWIEIVTLWRRLLRSSADSIINPTTVPPLALTFFFWPFRNNGIFAMPDSKVHQHIHETNGCSLNALLRMITAISPTKSHAPAGYLSPAV